MFVFFVSISKCRQRQSMKNFAIEKSSLDNRIIFILTSIIFQHIRTVLLSNCPLIRSINDRMGQLIVNKTAMSQTGLTINCQWLIAASIDQVSSRWQTEKVLSIGEIVSEYFHWFRLFVHSDFDERIFTYSLSTRICHTLDYWIETWSNGIMWRSTSSSSRWNRTNVNDSIEYDRS